MVENLEEPSIKVGLISGAASVRFELSGQFITDGGEVVKAGEYTATFSPDTILINGAGAWSGAAIQLSPVDFASCQFKIHDVVIGINFHWQRKETQTFQGTLRISRENNSLSVINEL